MNAGLPSVTLHGQPAPRPEEEPHLRDAVHAILAGRWILGGVLAACVGAALLYCFMATPQYRADALVQVEKKSKSVTGSSDDLYELLSGRDSISTEIELLKSRMVIGRVVDQLRLDKVAAPRRFPLIGGWVARGFEPSAERPLADAPLGLTRYGWGGERIEIGAFTVPDALIGEGFVVRSDDGAGAYTLLLNDTPIGQGRVGEALTFTTPQGEGTLFVRDLTARPDTEFDARVLRRLEVIQGLSRSLQVTERGRMSAILAITLEGSDPARTTEIVNAIANAYQRQNVERRSAEADQTLAFVNEQLPIVQSQLEAAENALNRYRLQQKSADLTKETELVLQQSVQLEQQRVELQQKRVELLRRYTPSHPIIQGLDAQLSQIAAEHKALEARVEDLPGTQQALLRLSRDVKVSNELYTSLLNSAEQLQIARAGTIGNVRIVDYAITPFRPVKPAKAMVVTLAAVGGLFLGLIAVFVHRALTPGISDPAVVERQLHLPTYTSIPYAPAQRRIGRRIERGESVEGVLVNLEPANPAVEAIRSLRTALLVERPEASGCVLMLCGPSPNLGKSFVSVNLAASIALTGRKVALVDADVRRGRLHQYVAGHREPGLSDYIAGRCELERIAHPTQQENLFLVPTGAIPPNPSELLQSERFEQAVRWLARQHSYVIMDSAPVLAVTDAMIVGRLADVTLLVLKSGQHSLRELEDTVKRLGAAGVTPKGAVFNQVNRGDSGAYYARTGYYDYKYQSVR